MVHCDQCENGELFHLTYNSNFTLISGLYTKVAFFNHDLSVHDQECKIYVHT